MTYHEPTPTTRRDLIADDIRKTSTDGEHPLMTALGLGLPITLLVDLIDPNGPRSHEMLEREGMSAANANRPRNARDTAARTA